MIVVFYPRKAREFFRFSPFYAPILSIYGLKFLSSFHRSGCAEGISQRERGTLIYVFWCTLLSTCPKMLTWGERRKGGEKCGIEGPRTSSPPLLLWGGLERVSHGPFVFVLYHRQFAFCRFGDFFDFGGRAPRGRFVGHGWTPNQNIDHDGTGLD